MRWLVTWAASGTAINWILGLVAAEAGLLIAYRHITHQGLRTGPIVSLLLPGACLLLALRCALTNGAPVWMAAWLLAAFVSHLADVALRWRASACSGSPKMSS
jgi:hypothetical protein